ncbi:hypothetical protein Taro_055490 [Colocasia esculenta]|uniref:Uncharacterized protein n=1 Tax=Colocasia esculenta TaxID=4460 RepID=A0A843XR46_COLES|nr:hypothetical protein [Colocasia esculenta]
MFQLEEKFKIWLLLVSALLVIAHAYGGIGLCRSLSLPPLRRSVPLPHLKGSLPLPPRRSICTILGEGHWSSRAD